MPQTVVTDLGPEQVQPLQFRQGLEVAHPRIANLGLFQGEIGDFRQRGDQPEIFVHNPCSVELHFHNAIPILEDACPKGFQFLDDLRFFCSRTKPWPFSGNRGQSLPTTGLSRPKEELARGVCLTDTLSIRPSLVSVFVSEHVRWAKRASTL